VSDASAHPIENRPLGIALRASAMVAFACLGALVKWTSQHQVPVFEIIFFRNAFALVPVAAMVFSTPRGLSVLHTSRPMAHLLRSGIGIAAMVCGFTSTALLPLTQATALTFTTPLFMTALSALILKEHVGPHRWAAVAVGFIGVLVMVRPGAEGALSLGTVLGLAGAMLAAGATIAIREIGKTEPGPTIVFYFTMAGAALGLASLPFGWVMPNLWVLAALIAAGLVGGIGQLLITNALRVAPIAVIAPFDYTQLLWAGLLGYLVWGDTPGPNTLLGAVIVAASGVYILFRETRRRVV
jgi:drug/metabolite transporter (DMT)-like permease